MRPTKRLTVVHGWWLLSPAHITTIGFAVLLAMALPGALDPSLTSTSSMAGRGLIAIFLFGVVWTIGTTW